MTGRRVPRALRERQEIRVDIPAPFGRLGPSASRASPAGAQEGARMRSLILACLLGPALALGLAVGIAALGDFTESPYHPASFLPMVAGRMHDVSTAASEFAWDLLDWFNGSFRECLQRTIPPDRLTE